MIRERGGEVDKPWKNMIKQKQIKERIGVV
jgi:hypothetical protein